MSIGEGSTSQGEFWESLNTASNGKLPVLYVVEDNGYAISTPVEVNTPGGNISRLIANFPNFHFAEVDGTDPIASYAAMREAVEYCRSGQGPALVHGHVVRPYSHSLSDDERLYRSAAELEADALRDPIARMQVWLMREGILDADGIDALEKKVDAEVQAAADRAVAAKLPEVGSILKHQYSEDLSCQDGRFATEAAANPDATERTMADLINACLKDEMRRDERIVVFGEDVADATRADALKDPKVKGKGGVFKLTSGLQVEFGSDRVWNSPLAEANITGRAIGMAVRGLEAGGGDSILRLHMAGYASDAKRVIGDAVAVEWGLQLPAGDAGSDWRVSDWGVDLSLAVRGVDFYAYAGGAGGDAVKCAGCAGAAADGDPVRRSGAVPGAQEAVSGDVRAGGVSGAGVYDSVWEGEDRQGGEGSDGGDVRGGGAAGTAGGGEAAIGRWGWMWN